MNRRTQLKLRQLLIILLIWMLMSAVITVYDHLILLSENSTGPSAGYSFNTSLLMNLIRAIMGTLLGGSFLVFYVNVKYQDKPYAFTVLAVSISFILVIHIISFFIAIIKHNLYDIPFFVTLFDPIRLKNTIIWSIIVGLTQLFLQLNSKFGYGIFWNLIKGKYNTPKEENRVFMFLDINSSTAIAEKLGDEKYHEFLRQFYADITNPILDSRGEIYQYVGDEVLVAWKIDDGISSNNCITCFFKIRDHIEKNSEKYLARFNIVPTFKAGIHFGRVIVGEIGIIKRDVTYSGNVLNTTSRIRSKCKEFGTDVILSGELLSLLKIKDVYHIKNLGSVELRGKEEKVSLTALTL